VGRPTLRTEDAGPVTRVWFEFWGDAEWHVPFDDPRAEEYAHELTRLLGPSSPDRIVWLYTPMALHLARALEPTLLVYDVMDDLAAFAKASPQLKALQRETLEAADVVFAGGRSLHRGVAGARPDAHLFPSGVEPAHWSRPRAPGSQRGRPVAGYVGVIDERLDHELIAGLAAELPDWELQMVGPVSEKVDRESVPRAPNISYLGQQDYDRLPGLMARFDVAIMPFALNEATRSISPTKTLEYFAAGLPVVSTHVADVVADFADVVSLAGDAPGFAAACRNALAADAEARRAAAAPLLARNDWDAIASEMDAILQDALAARSAAT
jgi:glycosyltransferase involved in cell wall biosynthesis